MRNNSHGFYPLRTIVYGTVSSFDFFYLKIYRKHVKINKEASFVNPCKGGFDGNS